MAASPLICESFEVPAWVKRNCEIFRTPPPGFDPTKRDRRGSGYTAAVVAPMPRATGQAGVGMATFSEEDGLGSMVPPTSGPPASYYREVSNHGSILTTMLVSARRDAGFVPGLSGQQFTEMQAQEYSNKFHRWMMAMDEFWPYVDMVHTGNQQSIPNPSGDYTGVLEAVASFVESVMGMSGEIARGWRNEFTGKMRSADTFVGNSNSAFFQMETVNTFGKRDPIQPISFARTVMSDPTTGKYDFFLLSGFSFRVDSAEIIAAADRLASEGTTIFGAGEYRSYVNQPLNGFARVG